MIAIACKRSWVFINATFSFKAGPCSSDHIFEIITYELMKFCRHVVLYKSYMLNKFGRHVTFGGGVIV